MRKKKRAYIPVSGNIPIVSHASTDRPSIENDWVINIPTDSPIFLSSLQHGWARRHASITCCPVPVPSSRRNFQSYLRRPIEPGHLPRVISRVTNGRFHGEIGTAGRLISGDTFSRVSRRQRTLRDRDANAPNESGATSFSAGKLSMPPCPGRPLHRFWARG